MDGLAVEETIQILGQVARRVVAPGGIFLQALGDQGLQVLGEVGDDLAERLRLLQDELEEDTGEVQILERRDARQELVEDDAQTVDIRPPVEGLPLGLLGREVGRGAADHPGPRQPGLPLFHSEAEVDDEGMELARFVPGQEDVGGFQVAVDEAGPVGGVDRSRDVADEPQLDRERQRLAQLAQVLPVDVLHGDERPPLDFAHLVDLADVGVGDAGLGPGLAEETLCPVVVVAVQELERHVAVEGGVEGLEDRAHPAFAEEQLDPIAGPVGEEAVFRGKGRGGRFPGAGEVGGERGDGRRGQKAGVEKRLDPALLRRRDLVVAIAVSLAVSGQA